ncbi:hypothetical protein VB776_08740 [Arcicella sp. DC2W]|uniref:Uncharacterized protein n=1 Tax=Arcicella gelida TaxID=2984195 RepID=A0ABU5S3N7_9BACT|nr:hypothetical protein [Arcicella sp. DC2W]MEA5402999.1 hypothetical protein [Arcicella sp. DC2W]
MTITTYKCINLIRSFRDNISQQLGICDGGAFKVLLLNLLSMFARIYKAQI